MKKIFLTTFLASLLFVTGDVIVSAQYYYYPNTNYTLTNGYNYQNTLNNCYYTNTYPPTYYGNCQTVNYTYPSTNQVVYYTPTYTYQQYPTVYYQNTPYQQRTIGQYYTYGYYNGSWYPGYSTNNLTNLVNTIFQGNNCSYRDGYQYCY